MNPQPKNSADTELKADVPDVVEQKVVSINRALRKEVKSLPIGNLKYVKVCHYRKRPFMNIHEHS